MLNGKIILITGGTGSWGQELTKQILEKYSPKEIRIYSRGEHNQVEMVRKFNAPCLKFIIGDVRDYKKLETATQNVDIIFHLAALKHVPVCERNPEETIKTNIIGAMNIIEAAIKKQVKKVINISTDKASEPFNLYGMSKAVAERIIIAANQRTDQTIFVNIRGGNVLGSNGSIVPLFKEQILKANEITITDETMTRFIFKLEDAIKLIFKATETAVGGEIFVMKMPSITVGDIAEVMIKKIGNSQTKKRIIGIRPGEKKHEILVSKNEGSNIVEDDDFFIILPLINLPKTNSHYSTRKNCIEEYNSLKNKVLSEEEIEQLLSSEKWLEEKRHSQLTRYSKEEIIDFFKLEGWK